MVIIDYLKVFQLLTSLKLAWINLDWQLTLSPIPVTQMRILYLLIQKCQVFFIYYVVKNEARYLRYTNKLVSEKLSLVAIDIDENKVNYTSISNCSKALGFGRLTIKNCLYTGNIHKGYQFVYNV